MLSALKSLSKEPGNKRGSNFFNAVESLIGSLIRVYEEFTNKRVDDNFKQPKAHGACYQGQFYDFAYVVFEIINNNYTSRYENSKNIFSIYLDEFSSLGKHIQKVIKIRKLIKLGKRIRELRLSRGFSQESFAYEVSLDRTYMGSIERVERNVAAINLIRIAKILKIEVGELFPPIRGLPID